MKNIACLMMLTLVSFSLIGCGMLTDKDRKVIAEVDGEPIRRSDLRKHLRDMSDEERPFIQSQNDLLRVLNTFINTQLKSELATELKEAGTIEIERDLGRDTFMEKNPEFKNMENLQNTEELGFTQGQIASMKAQIEYGIDDEMDILYQEAAIQFKVNELIQSGNAKVSDEEFEAEYEIKKNSFKSLEFIDFLAIKFPFNGNQSAAAKQEAAKAYQRILDGENFEDVLTFYMQRNKQLGMRSAMENNPDKPLFSQFWHNVTGCKQGDIIGPLLLPPHDQMRPGPNGQAQSFKAPAAYIVLRVEEHRPPSQKTIDQAKPEMVNDLLAQQVINNLRDAHNVVVYKEELWRPEGYGDQYKDSMINVGQQTQ